MVGDAARVDEAQDPGWIRVRELAGIEDMEAASTLWDAIWRRTDAGHEVDPALMVALAHAGSYVAAAYDGDTMIGAALGFWGGPGDPTLHSHVTGVLPTYAGRGVGTEIKTHQREWVLEHGGTSITWTYDPLVSRNAHVNLNRLGARPERYLRDVYGALTDDLNRGDPSDRLLVRWSLTGPPAPASARPAMGLVVNHDGRPVVGLDLDEVTPDTPLTVAVPDDITALRRQDPATASLWRAAIREALDPLLDRGWSVTGFARGTGYRLELRHPHQDREIS